MNDGVRLEDSSIEQRPDTRICIVRRISDGMKEGKGDGSQRISSSAVLREKSTLAKFGGYRMSMFKL